MKAQRLKYIFYQISSMLFGPMAARRLIKKHKGIFMILTLENIGDQCLELAYSLQYKRQEGLEKLAILTTNPDHAVFQYFRGQYDELIRISKFEHEILFRMYRHSFFYRFKMKYPQLRSVYYLAGVQRLLFANNRYLKIDRIQKAIYHLPLDTEPCDIQRSNISHWISEIEEKDIISYKNTIILNPYANSQRMIPESVFEKLTEKLLDKGFKVITSISGNQRAIKGSTPLRLPLNRSVELADFCGFVIGLRSGFMDLISFSDAAIISIDNPETYDLAYTFVLEDIWRKNSFIKTYHFNEYENQIDTLIKLITDRIISFKFLKEDNKNGY